MLRFALLLLLAAPVRADTALIAAARGQVGVTVHYDPAYVSLGYPMGDVDRARGVCTDVVIRALREAHGIDLQRAVHRDMARAFSAYPKTWGLSRTDRNIDHRRVGNLATLLSRVGAQVETGTKPEDFQPGDIVTQVLPGNLPHIAIVSDRRSADGLRPLVLHNIGRGAVEEDTLFVFQITGQYRLEGPSLAALRALDAP